MMVNCVVCGRETQNIKFCSKRCYGAFSSKTKNGRRVYACCGEEKQLEEFPRRGGGRRYSYCDVCHRAKILKISHTLHDRWMRARHRAKRKRLAWDISEHDYCELLSQPCHYCGGALGISGVGLDRKDGPFGYVGFNVVPCCKRCNVVKNDYFTYDEMMLLSPVLRAIKNNRK